MKRKTCLLLIDLASVSLYDKIGHMISLRNFIVFIKTFQIMCNQYRTRNILQAIQSLPVSGIRTILVRAKSCLSHRFRHYPQMLDYDLVFKFLNHFKNVIK